MGRSKVKRSRKQKQQPIDDESSAEGSSVYYRVEAKVIMSDNAYIGKQGHVFCSFCCDTRRATMIMNFMSFLGCIAAIVGVVLVSMDILTLDALFLLNNEIPDWDDDDLQTDLQMLVEEYSWAAYTFLGFCSLIAIIGVVGAVQYKAWMVLLAAFWYCCLGIASLVLLGLGGVGVFVAGFFVYPNVMFYQEILEGVMSPSNYLNEQYSCCCLSPVKERKITIQEATEDRLGVFS